MGGNTVGLDAAAWRYFGPRAGAAVVGRERDARRAAERALAVHPGKNRHLLLAKRNRLLDSLREQGALDALACELAKREPLPPRPAGCRRWRRTCSRGSRPSGGRALPDRRREPVGAHLARQGPAGARRRRAGAPPARRSPRTAFTTRPRWCSTSTAGACSRISATVQPGDGDRHGEHVDVVRSPRSTGSILKPLLYAAMLESGEVLPRPADPDVPTHIGAFHPENFDRTYAGAVPAERALARSLNVPASACCEATAWIASPPLLRRLGVSTLQRPAQQYGLALILGGAEGTLYDITGVYAGLARSVEPERRRPKAAAASRRLCRGESRARGSAARRGRRLSHAAGDAAGRAPGDEQSWRSFATSAKIAWKTGTSYGHRDAWAVGVTPHYAVGVWVGNADGEGRPGPHRPCRRGPPILFELFGLLRPAAGSPSRGASCASRTCACAAGCAPGRTAARAAFSW
jgi:penicillin-binding protein 1C